MWGGVSGRAASLRAGSARDPSTLGSGPRLAPPQHCTAAAGPAATPTAPRAANHRGGRPPPSPTPPPPFLPPPAPFPPPALGRARARPAPAHPPVCYGRGHVPPAQAVTRPGLAPPPAVARRPAGSSRPLSGALTGTGTGRPPLPAPPRRVLKPSCPRGGGWDPRALAVEPCPPRRSKGEGLRARPYSASRRACPWPSPDSPSVAGSRLRRGRFFSPEERWLCPVIYLFIYLFFT